MRSHDFIITDLKNPSKSRPIEQSEIGTFMLGKQLSDYFVIVMLDGAYVTHVDMSQLPPEISMIDDYFTEKFGKGKIVRYDRYRSNPKAFNTYYDRIRVTLDLTLGEWNQLKKLL